MKKTHLIAPLVLVAALLLTAGFITANTADKADTPADKPAECSKTSDAAQCEKSASTSSCSLEKSCDKTKSSCSKTAASETCPEAKIAYIQKSELGLEVKNCPDGCQKECCSKKGDSGCSKEDCCSKSSACSKTESTKTCPTESTCSGTKL